MRRTLSIAIFVLAAALAGAAADKLTELMAKAQSAQGPKRAELLAQIAYEHVLVADHHFTEGRPADGHKTVIEVVKYAEQARDVAVQQGRKAKRTEMTIRKAARKLEDVRRSLAFEDQADVTAAVKRLHELQDEILEAMFAPPKKPEDKS
jgi:hypothetical protein